MARGGMLDVVLADDDEPDVGEAGPPGTGPGEGRARAPDRRGRGATWATGEPPASRRRRPRARLLVVVAAVVLAAATAGLLDGDRADERAARLAGVPGVLARLEGSLPERWRAPGGSESTVTIGGGVVVALFLTPAPVLVGTDAVTGDRRWTAPVPEVSDDRDLECVTVDTAAAVGSAGQRDPGAAGAATHVVCRLVTARASLAEGAQGFAASTLVVLDARTGTRAAERLLDSRFSTLAVAGPHVLLVELRPDGHGAVVRVDPVTGTVLWTSRTSRPLPDLSDGLPAPTAQVRHGVIAVDGPAAWALTPAGSLLGEWYPRGGSLAAGVRRAVDLTVLPDGRFAVTDATTEGDGLGTPAGTVSSGAPASDGVGPRDPDAFPIPGRVLTPVVDDGSAPDVLLTVPVGAGQVVAVDTGSGRELWRAEIRVGGRAVLLDRRLVIGSGRGVRALDVRSGAVRWVAGPQVVPSGPDLLTDGEVVLVPVLQRDRRPTLVALGLADGRERWRAAVPAGISQLRVLDGRLLALTTRETVALGPDVAS